MSLFGDMSSRDQPARGRWLADGSTCEWGGEGPGFFIRCQDAGQKHSGRHVTGCIKGLKKRKCHRPGAQLIPRL